MVLLLFQLVLHNPSKMSIPSILLIIKLKDSSVSGPSFERT